MTTENKKHFTVIGLMSGTSLDGLDIAYCEFDFINGFWTYKLPQTVTYPFSEDWKSRLYNAPNEVAANLVRLDMDFGAFCGMQVLNFIRETGLCPEYIASHGHTVFHRPDLFYTLQIGSGAVIAATTGITTICDFRSQDVALGGQGAPLVPIGDRLLFKEYQKCLNIGGFANISYESEGKRIAYDISPANIILNQLAEKAGFEFDKDGVLASSGNLINQLLVKLNALNYYQKCTPKSLAKEWLEEDFLPIIKTYSDFSLIDILHTVVEHIAIKIAEAIGLNEDDKVLVTGGGAFNRYLVNRIKSYTSAKIIIPDSKIIQFKEALIFAFLGILRITGQKNCLASATGALKDHCSGAIYPWVD